MEIRRLQRADVEGVVALQRACFPPPFPEELLWKREHIERHLPQLTLCRLGRREAVRLDLLDDESLQQARDHVAVLAAYAVGAYYAALVLTRRRLLR